MITEREKAFLNHWKTKRAIGKWKFALIHGALFWGIPVCLALQLFYYLFDDGYTFETERFIVSFIVWLIVGFFGFGLLMWWLNERAYQKIGSKKTKR